MAKPVKETPRLDFLDLKAEESAPEVAVYTVDHAFNITCKASVNKEGRFHIADRDIKNASRVLIGPDVEVIENPESDRWVQYSSEQFLDKVKSLNIEIPLANWNHWLYIKRCVQGSVRHCTLFPWIPQTVLDSLRDYSTASVSSTPFTGINNTTLNAVDIQNPYTFVPIKYCDDVCEGQVEVYRRQCCSWPYPIYNISDFSPAIPPTWSGLSQLRVDLEKAAGEQELSLVEGGALNANLISLRDDVEAIAGLNETQTRDYVLARPYLWRRCGQPVKLGQTLIQPNGKFSFCFKDSVFRLWGCHYQYAFVVKQIIQGQPVTIYDGVKANQWYAEGAVANLVSYHRDAISCRGGMNSTTEAFALLERIGTTDSWRLQTPAQNGDFSVAASGFTNPGLVNPVGGTGYGWCGSLDLHYAFSDPLKTAGAHYYRVSIRKADANGQPTGTAKYIDQPLSWSKYQPGPSLTVTTESLGPQNVSGEANLYKIPYRMDAFWRGGQSHAVINTGDFVNGGHLVTLELFDVNGQPVANPFDFRRCVDATNKVNVNRNALTHMFWWDNRRVIGHIHQLAKDGVKSNEECQFLEGPGTSQFSVEYEAWHPDPRFLLQHRLWWRRGLGGSSGNLQPTTSAQQKPKGLSPAASFDTMLAGCKNPDNTPCSKCSFSVNLNVYAKLWTGRSRHALDKHDQAAFAIEKI